MVAAANDTITALTGTPSTVAIYTFNQTTGVSIAKTSTINAATGLPLHNFINTLPTPTAGTNWDQGLAQVTEQVRRGHLPDRRGPHWIENPHQRLRAKPLYRYRAGDLLRQRHQGRGDEDVGVGIGLNGGEDNLRAVSGPTVNQDYFLGSNTGFGDILKQLATGSCNNQLTITKQIQGPTGALISPTPADANGWTFANTISAGSTIASPATPVVVNGANGVGSAAVTIPAGATPTVTVTETLKAGYTFVSAQCSVGGAAVTTSVTGTTATFTGAAAQAMACTFTNKRPGLTIATGPSAGGPVGTSVHDTATLTGGVTPTGNVTFQLFAPGDSTCICAAGLRLHQSAEREPARGHLWLLPDRRGGHLPLGGHLQRRRREHGGQLGLRGRAGDHYPGDSGHRDHGLGGRADRHVCQRHGVGERWLQPDRHGDLQAVPRRRTPPVLGRRCSPPHPVRLAGGSASSGNFTPTTVGTYRWVATYNGDANNTTVSSGCAGRAGDHYPGDSGHRDHGRRRAGPIGTSVSDTASVSGGFSPTGTVTFELPAPADTTCAGAAGVHLPTQFA